jgi:hypothetical protein
MNRYDRRISCLRSFAETPGRETVFLWTSRTVVRRLFFIEGTPFFSELGRQSGDFPMSQAVSRSAARAEAILSLRRQMKSAAPARARQSCVPTGIAELDAQLPDGGLPTAAVIEWISEGPGLATASTALRAVIPMLAQPGALVIIDERREFNAEAALALGVPLSRILLVRPQQRIHSPANRRRASLEHSDSLWALEQAARCPGVRVVLCWLDRATTAVMRRLQLAVERSGTTLLLIRPASVLQQPSFADIRVRLSRCRLPGGHFAARRDLSACDNPKSAGSDRCTSHRFG